VGALPAAGGAACTIGCSGRWSGASPPPVAGTSCWCIRRRCPPGHGSEVGVWLWRRFRACRRARARSPHGPSAGGTSFGASPSSTAARAVPSAARWCTRTAATTQRIASTAGPITPTRSATGLAMLPGARSAALGDGPPHVGPPCPCRLDWPRLPFGFGGREERGRGLLSRTRGLAPQRQKQAARPRPGRERSRAPSQDTTALRHTDRWRVPTAGRCKACAGATAGPAPLDVMRWRLCGRR
jgi:hypothetical protein